MFSFLILISLWQLRLISYSSADSFIKRDYILDVVDSEEKSSFKFLENHFQPLRYDQVNVKMSDKKTIFVQHRREYYNDFADCLREYRQQNQKTKPKSKIHHSDGDNGESDSEYLDCTNDVTVGDLKSSSHTSKSMPHVSSESHHENEIKSHKATAEGRQAQLSSRVNNSGSEIRNDLSRASKLIEHNSVNANDRNNNNKNNQPTNKNVLDTRESDKANKAFVNEKSMTIDVCPTTKISTPKLSTSDVKKMTAVSIDISDIPVVVKKDEVKERKRKSCKKRQGSIKNISEK